MLKDNLSENRLLRHSILMLAATQIGNLANMLFQFLMNRRLGDQEYGELAAMLGLILIIATPLDSLRATAAHFSAKLRRHNQEALIGAMLKHWLKLLVLPVTGLFLLGWFSAPAIAYGFNLSSALLIRMTIILAVLSILQPVFTGVLQGLDAFGWFSAAAPIWGITRLGLAAVLTLKLTTAAAGLLAQGGGILTVSVFAWFGLRKLLPKPTHADRQPDKKEKARFYFMGAFFSLLGFAVLMNADVVLIKIFFSPEKAGLFARAANIARAIVFLPMPIALAMFPKVVSGETKINNSQNLKTLLHALTYTLILIMAVIIACYFLDGLLWRIFTGSKGQPEELYWLRRLVWGLAPLGPAYLILNFELARKRFLLTAVLAVLALLYFGAAACFHASFEQILTILTSVSLAAAVSGLFVALPVVGIRSVLRK